MAADLLSIVREGTMSETAKGPFDARTASVEEIRRMHTIEGADVDAIADRIEALERERDDARNYAAEIAQGVTHYPHGDGEPCVRCERDEALAKLAEWQYEWDECNEAFEGEGKKRDLADDIRALRRERDEAREVAESLVTGEGGSLSANLPWRKP